MSPPTPPLPGPSATAPATLHRLVVERLREAAGTRLTVFDGEVRDPPTVSATDRRVLPYLVVWGARGTHPEEARSLGGWDGTERDIAFQVTAAAGTQTWCLQAADLADRALLDGALPLPSNGVVLDGGDAGPVRLDPDTAPPRWFLPLLFRAVTG